MAVSVQYTVIDGKGRTGGNRINLPDGLTQADMIQFAQELGNLILPLITGRIDSVSLCIDVPLTALMLARTPAANSDVEEGLQMIFNSAAGFKTRTRLPTLDEGKLVSGSINVDTTDADVSAFIDAMVDGLLINATQVEPTDARNSDVTGFDAGYEQFQRSRGRRT